MKTDNNIKKFLNKKSFLKHRLNKEILEEGTIVTKGSAQGELQA